METASYLNPEIFHYMCLEKDVKSDLPQFCEKHLKPSELETILGIENDNKLNFENHIKTRYIKASQKIGASQRISIISDAQKKNLLLNITIKSQFRYGPHVCGPYLNWIL